MMIQTSTRTVKVEYLRGESRCQCCGRDIRNIVRIDDVDFGIRCCESVLPRSEYAKVSKDFTQAMYDAALAEWETERAVYRNYIIAAGFERFFNISPAELADNKQAFAKARPALALFALEEYRRISANPPQYK